jgi:hypothetical protein
MNSEKFSIPLPFDIDTVLALISLRLVSEGFAVAHSFELDSACASFTETACPHTGRSPCDCRLVTLFACNQNDPPVPLVFHGHADRTEIHIETTAQQPDLDLVEQIQAILQNESVALMSLNDHAR